MSEADWYYARGGQQVGPVGQEELQRLAQAGQLHSDDLIWREGMVNWVAAGAQPELFGGGVMTAAPAAAGAAPLLDYGQRYGSSVEYAGFWLRFVASIIDSIVTSAVGRAIAFPVGLVVGLAGAAGGARSNSVVQSGQLLGNVIDIVVSWLYFAMMESSSKQATLGKMALGLIVTDMNGERISFGKATGRYFGKIISALILMIGYIMAGVTEKKQALHDIMAGCLVVRRKA